MSQKRTLFIFALLFVVPFGGLVLAKWLRRPPPQPPVRQGYNELYVFDGRLIDQYGQPVAGAKVHATVEQMYDNGLIPATKNVVIDVVTDSVGVFRIRDVYGVQIHFEAEKEGYTFYGGRWGTGMYPRGTERASSKPPSEYGTGRSQDTLVIFKNDSSPHTLQYRSTALLSVGHSIGFYPRFMRLVEPREHLNLTLQRTPDGSGLQLQMHGMPSDQPGAGFRILGLGPEAADQKEFPSRALDSGYEMDVQIPIESPVTIARVLVEEREFVTGMAKTPHHHYTALQAKITRDLTDSSSVVVRLDYCVNVDLDDLRLNFDISRRLILDPGDANE